MNGPLHIQILEVLQQNRAIGKFVDIKFLFEHELNTKEKRKNFKDELDYLTTAGLIAADGSYAFLIWDTLNGLYPLDNKQISLRLNGNWETYLINKRAALKSSVTNDDRDAEKAIQPQQRRVANTYQPPQSVLSYPTTQQRQTINTAMPTDSAGRGHEQQPAQPQTSAPAITPDMPEYYLSKKTYPDKNAAPAQPKQSRFEARKRDDDIPKVKLVFPEKEEITPIEAAKKFFSLKEDNNASRKQKPDKADNSTESSAKAEAPFIATLSKLFGSKSKPDKAKKSVAQAFSAEPETTLQPQPEPVAVPQANANTPVSRIVPKVTRKVEEEDNAPFITARTAFLKGHQEPKTSAWSNSDPASLQSAAAPANQPQPVPELPAPTPDVIPAVAAQLEAWTEPEAIAEPKPWVNTSGLDDKFKPLPTSLEGPEQVFQPRGRNKRPAVTATTSTSVWDEPAQPVAETPKTSVGDEPVETVTETPNASVWDETETAAETPKTSVWDAPVDTAPETPNASVWDEPETVAEPVKEAPQFTPQVNNLSELETKPAANFKPEPESWREPTIRPNRPAWPHLPLEKSVSEQEPEPAAFAPQRQNIPVPEAWQEPYVAPMPTPEPWHKPAEAPVAEPQPWVDSQRTARPEAIPEPPKPQPRAAAIPHTLVPISDMPPGPVHLKDNRAPGTPVKPQVKPSSIHFSVENNPFADLGIIPIVNTVDDEKELRAGMAWLKWAVGGIIFIIILVAFLAYKHRYYS